MESRMERRMGRWSELRVMEVDQVKEGARWAETREISGEDGLPEGGRRVGVSTLREMKEEESMEEEMESPRASFRVENQLSSWALKSPRMIASSPSRAWRSGSRLKRWRGGQEEAGGT